MDVEVVVVGAAEEGEEVVVVPAIDLLDPLDVHQVAGMQWEVVLDRELEVVGH